MVVKGGGGSESIIGGKANMSAGGLIGLVVEIVGKKQG